MLPMSLRLVHLIAEFLKFTVMGMVIQMVIQYVSYVAKYSDPLFELHDEIRLFSMNNQTKLNASFKDFSSLTKDASLTVIFTH